VVDILPANGGFSRPFRKDFRRSQAYRAAHQSRLGARWQI
jgi:hypothetical protein